VLAGFDQPLGLAQNRGVKVRGVPFALLNWNIGTLPNCR
jgi:hypothetical protein